MRSARRLAVHTIQSASAQANTVCKLFDVFCTRFAIKSILAIAQKRCEELVDRYVEFSIVNVMIDLMLHRIAAYRHLLRNIVIRVRLFAVYCISIRICTHYRTNGAFVLYLLYVALMIDG